MNNFPPAPESNTTLNNWLARFHGATQRLRPGASSTIKTTHGQGGITYEVNEDSLPQQQPFEWLGIYDETAPYSWNAWVKVTEAKDYTDSETKTVYRSLPGLYMCVSPVAPKLDLTKFKDPYLIKFYTTHRQTDGVVYAPVVGMTETLAHETADGRGRYWEPISILCS